MPLVRKGDAMFRMMPLRMAFTFDQVLPLILALLLIFIIPMIMARTGLTVEDLYRMLFFSLRKKEMTAEEAEKYSRDRKNRREPHLHNGGKNELMELVSTLMIFSRRNKCVPFFPATIEWKGKLGGLAALIVMKNGAVYAFNCFGFSGTITEMEEGRFVQHMNGVDTEIPNPLKGNKEQYALARAAMDSKGMRSVPLKVFAVFTNRNVTLNTRHPEEIFTEKGLIAFLKTVAAEGRGNAGTPSQASSFQASPSQASSSQASLSQEEIVKNLKELIVIRRPAGKGK